MGAMRLFAVLFAAATAQAGGLSWKPPAGWTAEPPSSAMRVVTYRVPPAPGDREPGEVGVFFFGAGEGGSVEANIDRWIAQFASEPGSPKPARRVETVNGIRVTRVSIEGTYSSGMPGGPRTPKPAFALIGAIAEGPGGNVFFKLTGPSKTVHKAAPQFEALVRSLSRK
jgi:hypothetical protein